MKLSKITLLSIGLLLLVVQVKSVNPSPRHSLKGISAVAIRIDRLPEYMRVDGISELSIKYNIEKQLKEAKIRVVEYEKWQITLGGSYLNVKIVPGKTYSGEKYVIYTQIELMQTVTLIRAQIEQNKIIIANTWSAGKLMNCATQSLDTCLQSSIRQIVEIFVNEFKKMN